MELVRVMPAVDKSTLPLISGDFGTARWQLWNNATSILRLPEEGRFRI
jgi:hypothetical protein